MLKTVENVLLSESTHQPVTVHIGPVTTKLKPMMLSGLAQNVTVNVPLVPMLDPVTLVPVLELVLTVVAQLVCMMILKTH